VPEALPNVAPSVPSAGSIPPGRSATPAAGSVPPGRPARLAARAGDSLVSLSWAAPSGGSPVTGYRVYDRTSGSRAWAFAASATGTSATVPRLVNGTTYEFVVTAVNGDVESGQSNVASATPSGRGSISGLELLLIIVLGVAALVGAALAVRRWRLPRRHSVSTEAHKGPPGRVAVHSTGSRPTVTVRIEPHPGAARTKIEEMR
jgi:hypothetical protein